MVIKYYITCTFTWPVLQTNVSGARAVGFTAKRLTKSRPPCPESLRCAAATAVLLPLLPLLPSVLLLLLLLLLLLPLLLLPLLLLLLLFCSGCAWLP